MPTQSQNTFRSQLLDLVKQNRGYDFVRNAIPYLRVEPDDHQVRLLLAREYVSLRLIEPALEVLAPKTSGEDWPEDLQSVRSAIGAVAPTASDFSSMDSVYRANLAVLESRGVGIESITRAWSENSQRFRHFLDSNGKRHVQMLDDVGEWQWHPSFCDHELIEESRPLPEDIKLLQPGPYLLDGVGLGGFVERLYDATLDTFLGYSCPLFVVEPRAEFLAAALHFRDWRRILADHRVFVFAGDGWGERLIQAFDDDTDLPWPVSICDLSQREQAGSPHILSTIQKGIEQRAETAGKSLERITSQYEGCTIEHWAKRFAEAVAPKGRGLRVLVPVSTHTSFLKHSIRDTKRALERLGHTCLVLTEQTPYTMVGPLTIHKAIAEFKPDLFLALDHLRTSFRDVLPSNLPLLTWDQDQLPNVFTPENMRAVPPQDFVVGCSKADFLAAGCNSDQYIGARVPTCPEQFGGDPLTDEEQSQYESDVSFVSHASQTPAEFHAEQRAAQNDPMIIRLLDELYDLLPPALAEYHVVESELTNVLLEQASRKLGIESIGESLEQWIKTWYLWRLGDRIFRHEALEWVGKWARERGKRFRIYGNGWDKHPALGEFAAGPAENGRELLCIYRASKVNLQLMPAGFIHQRALDGLAAGGFFLTRLAPNDLRGKTLRALATRLRELGILDMRSALECSDDTLKALFNEYLGRWLHRLSPSDDRMFYALLANAEVLYPDEVFPRFADITFHSEAGLFEKMDLYIENTEERLSVATEMREVVLGRFTYEASMARFISGMAEYLAGVAAR